MVCQHLEDSKVGGELSIVDDLVDLTCRLLDMSFLFKAFFYSLSSNI